MSDVLTVHTHFEDISELAQGLADRVDENQIILYGPESYEEGAELGFQVLLADGTPGLEGSGFVTATYDGGEDRDPDTRYDVVIAGLRLEGMSEVVFERLMVARASLVGDEPPSTEMAVPEGLAEAVAAEEVAEVADVAEPVEEAVEAVAAEEVAEVEEAAPAPIEAMFDDEATTVASAADFLAEEAEPEPEPVAAEEVAEVAEPEPVAAAPVEPPAPAPVAAPAPAPVSAPEPVAAAAPAARPQAREIPAAVEVAPIAGGGRNVGATGEGFRGVPPPNAPPVPPGFTVQKDLDADQLARPALASAWQPEARPAEPSGPSDGLFQYGGPIPIPNKPPRPELSEAERVSKAPAPTTEDAYRNLRASLGFAVPAPAAQPAAPVAPPPAAAPMAAVVDERVAEAAADDVADDVMDEVDDVEEAVDLDPAEG
ncbi:MAG: hypothetical protein U0230_11610 [Polyangiales bacterium]